MPKPRGASWKQKQLHRMKYLYKPVADKWERESLSVIDDRRAFLKMYRMIVSALESLSANPDLYVRIAVDRKIKTDMALMDVIVQRFEGVEFMERQGAARGGAGA